MVTGEFYHKGAQVIWSRPTDEITAEERCIREGKCYQACMDLINAIESRDEKESQQVSHDNP